MKRRVSREKVVGAMLGLMLFAAGLVGCAVDELASRLGYEESDSVPTSQSEAAGVLRNAVEEGLFYELEPEESVGYLDRFEAPAVFEEVMGTESSTELMGLLAEGTLRTMTAEEIGELMETYVIGASVREERASFDEGSYGHGYGPGGYDGYDEYGGDEDCCPTHGCGCRGWHERGGYGGWDDGYGGGRGRDHGYGGGWDSGYKPGKGSGSCGYGKKKKKKW